MPTTYCSGSHLSSVFMRYAVCSVNVLWNSIPRSTYSVCKATKAICTMSISDFIRNIAVNIEICFGHKCSVPALQDKSLNSQRWLREHFLKTMSTLKHTRNSQTNQIRRWMGVIGGGGIIANTRTWYQEEMSMNNIKMTSTKKHFILGILFVFHFDLHTKP